MGWRISIVRSQKGEGEADFYAHIGNTLQCKYRQNITCQCNGNQHVGPSTKTWTWLHKDYAGSYNGFGNDNYKRTVHKIQINVHTTHDTWSTQDSKVVMHRENLEVYMMLKAKGHHSFAISLPPAYKTVVFNTYKEHIDTIKMSGIFQYGHNQVKGSVWLLVVAGNTWMFWIFLPQ